VVYQADSICRSCDMRRRVCACVLSRMAGAAWIYVSGTVYLDHTGIQEKVETKMENRRGLYRYFLPDTGRRTFVYLSEIAGRCPGSSEYCLPGVSCGNRGRMSPAATPVWRKYLLLAHFG